MKKILIVMLAAIMLVMCAACSAAPASTVNTLWEYKDLSAIMISGDFSAIEDLSWKFNADEPAEIIKNMKKDKYFSSTFKNMWFKLYEDGTADYVRNGAPETYYWEYADDTEKVGYLAENKEDLGNTEKCMKFTVAEDGKTIDLECLEPYDADEYQYTAVYTMKPGK